MVDVAALFKARYSSDNEKCRQVREFCEGLIRDHATSGIADAGFLSALAHDDSSYAQRMSEALLANELKRAGIAVTPPASLPEVRAQGGPDFLIEHEGCRIWIEVICPTSAGLPADWLEPVSSRTGATSLPNDALLLRWTAAIKEKAEKLLGNADGKPGYLAKGVVKPTDAYVIAINASLLRSGGLWPSIRGVNQLPFAAAIAFAIGYYELRIDRQTLEAVSHGYGHRPHVFNRNSKAVATHTFLDPAFSAISAIWATDIREDLVIGNGRELAVVHNPLAQIPIPVGLLPAWEEHVATLKGEVGEVARLDGRLVTKVGK